MEIYFPGRIVNGEHTGCQTHFGVRGYGTLFHTLGRGNVIQAEHRFIVALNRPNILAILGDCDQGRFFLVFETDFNYFLRGMVQYVGLSAVHGIVHILGAKGGGCMRGFRIKPNIADRLILRVLSLCRQRQMCIRDRWYLLQRFEWYKSGPDHLSFWDCYR